MLHVMIPTVVWVIFGIAIPTSPFNFMQMYFTLVILYECRYFMNRIWAVSCLLLALFSLGPIHQHNIDLQG